MRSNLNVILQNQNPQDDLLRNNVEESKIIVTDLTEKQVPKHEEPFKPSTVVKGEHSKLDFISMMSKKLTK